MSDRSFTGDFRSAGVIGIRIRPLVLNASGLAAPAQPIPHSPETTE
ncbi:MAG: hypothetical protein R3E92_24290 [Burkholderiaceae bacterium]